MSRGRRRIDVIQLGAYTPRDRASIKFGIPMRLIRLLDSSEERISVPARPGGRRHSPRRLCGLPSTREPRLRRSALAGRATWARTASGDHRAVSCGRRRLPRNEKRGVDSHFRTRRAAGPVRRPAPGGGASSPESVPDGADPSPAAAVPIRSSAVAARQPCGARQRRRPRALRGPRPRRPRAGADGQPRRGPSIEPGDVSMPVPIAAGAVAPTSRAALDPRSRLAP